MRVIVAGGAGLPDQVAAALRNASDDVTVIKGDRSSQRHSRPRER
jgi:hypothetical protein